MLTAPPSNADEAIAALLASPDLAPLIAAHRQIDPRPPRHAPWPKGLDPRLVTALRGRGIEALYTHQAAAYEAASAKRSTTVLFGGVPSAGSASNPATRTSAPCFSRNGLSRGRYSAR